MKADSPIVEEVRQRAYELSARYGHDLHKYYAHLLEVQEQYRDRVVSQLRVVAATNDSAAATGKVAAGANAEP